MEREVFVLPNGETVLAWDLKFGPMAQQVETKPCKFEEAIGTFRNGTITFTVETGAVRFRICEGTLQAGLTGQLSTKDDSFYEVEITSIEADGEHELVTGTATRTLRIRSDS